jgi:hypothetical protein
MTVRRLGLTGVLAVLALPMELGGTDALRLQVLRNRITNFRPAEVSSAELRVTVDYTFTGLTGEDVTIHATPEEAGGIFDPRTVEFDEHAVEVGTHTATMTIVKRAGARDFTHVAIRVCMSTVDRALLCETFPHTKAWTAAPPPPAPTAPEPGPVVVETCSIAGEVSGRLEWQVRDDRGQPVTFALTEMVLMADGAPTRKASLKNRRYTFARLPAGVTYRVVPSTFRAEPPQRSVRCRGNVRYRGRDFRIIGPPPQG